MSLTLYIAENNLIELADLRRATDAALVSDANVAAQVYAGDGVTAIGDAVSMLATAVSGQYQGTFPAADAAGLELGAVYYLEIVVSGSYSGRRWVKCHGRYHGELP